MIPHPKPTKRRRIVINPTHLLITLSITLLIFIPKCHCYHVGETINTVMKLSSYDNDSHNNNNSPRAITLEALRDHMPRFGHDTAISLEASNLDMNEITTDERLRLSLSFGHGARRTHWVDVSDGRGVVLRTLTVTFTYSRGNGGEIHGVVNKAEYEDVKRNNIDYGGVFRVKYVWMEEEEDDANAAIFVMFLAVLVVCIGFLVEILCLSGGGDGSDYEGKETTTRYEEDFGLSEYGGGGANVVLHNTRDLDSVRRRAKPE